MVADARAIARRQLGAGSAGDAVRDELLAAAPVVRRLPRRLDRITAALEHGQLSINVRQLADERDRRVITALVHQVLLAFLGATTGLMGVIVLGAQGGPVVTQDVTLFQLLGYNLLVVSLLLMLRVLFIVFRPERRP
jgi:ubiquinone biosynthesis protein